MFLINAASFVAVLCSLAPARRRLHPSAARRARGSFVEGFRYVWARPDLRAILLMLFLIGTFGLNFPIFISTMAVTRLPRRRGQYGLLTSTMAIGSVAGALLAAGGRGRASGFCSSAPRSSGSAARWPRSCPTTGCSALALVVIGVSALTFTNSTNSLVQLATEPAMRDG